MSDPTLVVRSLPTSTLLGLVAGNAAPLSFAERGLI